MPQAKKQRISAGEARPARPCATPSRTPAPAQPRPSAILRRERPTLALTEGFREPPVGAPTLDCATEVATQSEPEGRFPVACRLDGRCTSCGLTFLPARGCVSGTLALPFNPHAKVQVKMVQHARLKHGLQGDWSAVRRLGESDPAMRLVWACSGEYVTEEMPKAKKQRIPAGGARPAQSSATPAPTPPPAQLQPSAILRGKRPTVALAEGSREPPAGLLRGPGLGLAE